MTWFSAGWRWGGAIYVGLVTLLAGVALTGDQTALYITLIVVTLPVGYLMLLPIYLVTSTAGWALGSGLEGSPVTSAIAIAGWALAAAANFLLLRLTVRGVSSWRSQRQLAEHIS